MEFYIVWINRIIHRFLIARKNERMYVWNDEYFFFCYKKHSTDTFKGLFMEILCNERVYVYII